MRVDEVLGRARGGMGVRKGRSDGCCDDFLSLFLSLGMLDFDVLINFILIFIVFLSMCVFFKFVVLFCFHFAHL